ncbi:hypothetical protein BC374_17695 [Ensifer sp. LC13]|nr:hypothetical protein BC362_10270 [Ensifer sp. LC14]OCP10904.1 hypothetical protein BC374_17695 [Ensifer sp. LC13]OCP11550.1 hypothetical protein BBX50_18160 [Ensifer sp. LC11]OCP33369.1 hypothetical protein BC364_17050 [Ensifer sp. LC499]
MIRKVGSSLWLQLGDVDSFTLNLAPTFIERKGKNGPVRTTRTRILNEIASTVSFTAMQKTKFIRAVSLLSSEGVLTQDAVAAGTFDRTVGIGDLIHAGHYDIADVEILSGATSLVEGTDFKVVDPEFGMIQILKVPTGVTPDASGKFPITGAYTATAITASDKRLLAKIGSNTEIDVEIAVRDVGKNSQPKVLRLWQVTLSPNGDIAYVDEDDVTGVQINGTALDLGGDQGIGIEVDLAA